jgi:hypothetical protein
MGYASLVPNVVCGARRVFLPFTAARTRAAGVSRRVQEFALDRVPGNRIVATRSYAILAYDHQYIGRESAEERFSIYLRGPVRRPARAGGRPLRLTDRYGTVRDAAGLHPSPAPRRSVLHKTAANFACDGSAWTDRPSARPREPGARNAGPRWRGEPSRSARAKSPTPIDVGWCRCDIGRTTGIDDYE